MSNVRHGHWVEEDNTGELTPEEPTVGSRRLLLGGVAGSMAMAASGLFLPAWLEEAEAREGALGGKLGGRRGKNRRGRNTRKRRNRGDRKGKEKDKDKPRGGSKPLFRNTALTLQIMDGHVDYFAFSATFFYRVKTGLDEYNGPWIDSRTTVHANGRHLDYRYASDHFRVGVLLRAQDARGRAPDLFIDVRNLSIGTPRGAAYVGENLDPARNMLGQTLIEEQAFDLTWIPFQGVRPKRVGCEYVLRDPNGQSGTKATGNLIRNPDSDDFIEFQLSLAVI